MIRPYGNSFLFQCLQAHTAADVPDVPAALRYSVHMIHLSSMKEQTEVALADLICQAWGEPLELVSAEGAEERVILSDLLYESEFGNPFFCEVHPHVTHDQS